MWFKKKKTKVADDLVTRTLSLVQSLDHDRPDPVDSGVLDRLQEALSPEPKPESLREELKRRSESFKQHQLRLQQQREDHFIRTTAEIRAALRAATHSPQRSDS